MCLLEDGVALNNHSKKKVDFMVSDHQSTLEETPDYARHPMASREQRKQESSAHRGLYSAAFIREIARSRVARVLSPIAPRTCSLAWLAALRAGAPSVSPARSRCAWSERPIGVTRALA